MAATKIGRSAARTRKAVVFSILDQNPSMSTEDALKELKRRKIDLGKNPKQNYYGVKTLWNQERGAKSPGKQKRRPGKPVGRRAIEPVATDMEQEIELQVLRAENAKLKGAIAIMLS